MGFLHGQQPFFAGWKGSACGRDILWGLSTALSWTWHRWSDWRFSGRGYGCLRSMGAASFLKAFKPGSDQLDSMVETTHLWFLEGLAIVREEEELQDDLSLFLRKPRPGKTGSIVQDIVIEAGELFVAIPILKSLKRQRWASLDHGYHGEMQGERYYRDCRKANENDGSWLSLYQQASGIVATPISGLRCLTGQWGECARIIDQRAIE